MRIKWHRLLMLLVVAMLAVAAAGCGGDDDEAGGTGTQPAKPPVRPGGTLVFAGAADPVALDGALVSDGESLRVITQIFETLVALKPGTTEPEPGLAESWSADDTGKVWTFKIREGVKFHDGTALDAEAVCFNFDRWYNFKGPLQNPSATYYWQVVFGGFKTYNKDSGAPEDSLYQSCEATDANTAVLTLTKPSATVHSGALAAGLLDRQPEGAEGVQGRRGHHRRGRRLPPDRARSAPSTRSARARSSSSRGPSTTSSRSSRTTTTGATSRRSTS